MLSPVSLHFNLSLAVLFSRFSPTTRLFLCRSDDTDENSAERDAINSCFRQQRRSSPDCVGSHYTSPTNTIKILLLLFTAASEAGVESH